MFCCSSSWFFFFISSGTIKFDTRNLLKRKNVKSFITNGNIQREIHVNFSQERSYTIDIFLKILFLPLSLFFCMNFTSGLQKSCSELSCFQLTARHSNLKAIYIGRPDKVFSNYKLKKVLWFNLRKITCTQGYIIWYIDKVFILCITKKRTGTSRKICFLN